MENIINENNMENMNKQNDKTIMDFASFRKYVHFEDFDCTEKVTELDNQRSEQEGNYINEQNAVKTVRWYKAWRDCDFTDEMVVNLIQANELLEDKIAEMYEAVHKLAKWEKRRLNKIGKPYAEEIVATLQVDYVDLCEDYDATYYRLFKHKTDTISKYRYILRNDEPTEEEPMSHHYDIKDIPETEICEAASVYDNFLREARINMAVAIQISSNFKTMLNLPENVGKKWNSFFLRLDKFQGNFFCLPLLAMIGRFKLTPQDVCAIRDYSYQININHSCDSVSYVQ